MIASFELSYISLNIFSLSNRDVAFDCLPDLFMTSKFKYEVGFSILLKIVKISALFQTDMAVNIRIK